MTDRLIEGVCKMIHPQALVKMFGYSGELINRQTSDMTHEESLAYFHFHEAHHVGQILYLAQFAGKQGVWLA